MSPPAKGVGLNFDDIEMRVLVIDDEPIALEKLKAYVQKTPQLELAGACNTAFEAMDLVKEGNIDMIISDINMPDLSGLDFIKTLKDSPMVVFTTAYPEYAVDSYKVSAVDYILKPYGFVEFSRAVNKALELHELRSGESSATPLSNSPEKTPSATARDNDSLFLKVDHRYVRVVMSDIRYIKGFGEYLQVFVEGRALPVVTLSSFASIRQKLRGNFLQVHRSYIVNLDKVQEIERSRLILSGSCAVPVSDSYRSALQQYLEG